MNILIDNLLCNFFYLKPLDVLLMCHYITPDSFNLESQIKNTLFINFLKFILGCRFSFEAYAKNVKEKATKCSLETTELLLDADGHVLT